MNKNKHGLGRPGPETRQYVRRRSRFGCVICGQIPAEYAHIRTSFADATVEDPDDILLLCDKHHKDLDNKIIDAEYVLSAMAAREKKNSGAQYDLTYAKTEYVAEVGSNIIQVNRNFIIIDGEPLLTLKRTPDPLQPVLISGVFHDRNGKELCRIEENSFLSRVDNIGDFEKKGNRFFYKAPDGRTILDFSLSAEKITIESCFFCKNDGFVLTDRGSYKFPVGDTTVQETRSFLIIGNAHRATLYYRCEFTHCCDGIMSVSTGTKVDFSNLDVQHILDHAGIMSNCSGSGCLVAVRM